MTHSSHDRGPGGRIHTTLVYARARNGIIGRDGGLPWRQQSDMRRFRALTTGKPVIMGRTTWESIGKPLPDRDNIVLSRRPAFRPSGAWCFGGYEPALAVARARAVGRGVREVCIIGGAEIYRLALPGASRIELSIVEADVEGDVLAPELDPAAWRVTAESSAPAGPRDDHPVTWITLERIG